MQPSGTLIEGKYEILEKIREGGMGAIYKVRHRLLDEIRVIKVIRPQAGPDGELKRRFTEEAKTATRLKHPNIATIYDFAVDEDGTAYLVMEFIDGVNLADLRASQGPVPLPLALEIAHQTLSALAYLHRKNIVHRDVAPDNLMLTRDEQEKPLVKLIDLGIAKALDRPTDLTATGMFLGKLKYASPEQYGALSPSETLDGRSDLYGFGVVLYELLTGARPFRGETPAELLKAHLTQPPPPFSESAAGKTVPPELQSLVLKSLEKNRENRFASADDFNQALEPLRRQFPLVGSLDPTIVIPSLRPAASPSAPAITPGAQDRIDQRFAGGMTPEPAISPAPKLARASRAATKGRGCTVRVAVQFAVVAAAAIGGFLVLRSRTERNPPTMSAAATPAPLRTPNAPPTVVVGAAIATPAETPPALAVPQPTPAAVATTPVPEATPAAATAVLTTTAVVPATPRSRNRTPSTVTPRAAASREEKVHLQAAAESARDRSAQARGRAEATEAPQFAAAFYEAGRAQEEVAGKLLSRGDWSGARVAFDLATGQYEKSESAARSAPRPSPTRERRRPTPDTRKFLKEQNRIRDTIRVAERAENMLDVGLYLRAFALADRRRVEMKFSKLRSQRVRMEILSIDIAPDGMRASARVSETRIAEPKEGGTRHTYGDFVFSMEKRGESWVITRASRQ